ncbi:hypothetical protein ACGFZK_33225 [Streptomyces sp. NPDC048257]|uniref:hypothetical protein n=1 Tax=Streptomyces sp. NPDC048257 TaxID=3365526 RepID=UPI00371656AC
MPRKAPSQVRIGLPTPTPRPHERGVVPRVSSGTLAAIARIEHRRFSRGDTYRSLRHWHRTVYQRGPWIIYPARDDDLSCCDWVGFCRGSLETVCLLLPPRARRELRAVITPLDERFLARTLHDPYAARDLPWWLQRLTY